MSQPDIKAKVHTPEVHARIGAKNSIWRKGNSPTAIKEMERIKALNPMSIPGVREKVSAILREMGHKPSVRGGNGKGLTVPQKFLLELLGGRWIPELAISLGAKQDGYPTCYKVDLGMPSLKIAVEIDGNTHFSRKSIDQKKDNKLSSLGWRVIRIKNPEVLKMKSMDRESVLRLLFEKGVPCLQS